MGRAPVLRPGTGRQRDQHRESPGLNQPRGPAPPVAISGRDESTRAAMAARVTIGLVSSAQALKATDMSLLPPSRRWATHAWMAWGTVTTCALAWSRSSLVTG